MRVTVLYRDEEVLVDIKKGQSFDEFKSWVLFRFQIPSSDKLIFKQQGTDDGLEVIPTYGQLKALKEKKRIVRVYNITSPGVDKSATTKTLPLWRRKKLKYWYPLLALVLLSVLLGGFSGHDKEGGQSGTILMLLRRIIDSYHFLWEKYVGITLPDKVVVDAITTLVAYPVTTFYIRRILNPDTGGVEASFQKYGSDVLFAALSSATLTHIKHFLKKESLHGQMQYDGFFNMPQFALHLFAPSITFTMAISLKYWNGRGLAEVPRMLLAIAGKEYEDGRYSEPPAGLEQNLGRMPVVSFGEESFGQSSAINFVVASECGLMGSSTFEAGHIIGLSEHLKEMMQAYMKLVPWGTEPSEETLQMWFEEGAKDVTGTADRAGASTRYLTWWAGRIEAILGNSGFAVGDKLSLADVLLYYFFFETLGDEHCTPDCPQFKKEPFGSQSRTTAMLAAHPRILASCQAVANHENVKKWRANRGVQGF